MSQHWTKLFLAGVFATPVLMAAAAGAPALAQGMADDSACVLAGLFGEEFGLCNAYCEAMDCDADTPQASPKACEKVRAKFEAIEGAPELPCLADQSLNDPPTLDLDFADTGTFDTTATFVSFGDAVPIAVDVEITDSDGDIIVSATVTLTNPLDGADETLSLSPAGHDLLVGLVSGAVTGDGTDTLLITGDGTLVQYSEILQEVVYDNALGNPDTTARMITVEVEDGGLDDFVSNAATSLVAVEVGCPCPTFSSDMIVNIDLTTYEPTSSGPFSPCVTEGVDCYVGNTSLPQTEACTEILTDTPVEFEYHININAFTPDEIDIRRFIIISFVNACSVSMTGATNTTRELDSLREFRSSAFSPFPWQFISPWTPEMTAACTAAIPRIRGLLLDFWESGTGFARLPRCAF